MIDGRVGFQTDAEDEFTARIERLPHRDVVAYFSTNQTTPGQTWLDAQRLHGGQRDPA